MRKPVITRMRIMRAVLGVLGFFSVLSPMPVVAQTVERPSIPTSTCAVSPQVTEGITANGAVAAVAGERVSVTSRATYGGTVYQSVLSRPDGSRYFAGYIELATDPALIEWHNVAVKVNGQVVAAVPGIIPRPAEWVLSTSTEPKGEPAYRLLLPADGAAMLAQATPQKVVVPNVISVELSAIATVPAATARGCVLPAAHCVTGYLSGDTNGAVGRSNASVSIIETRVNLEKLSEPAQSVKGPSSVGSSVGYAAKASVPPTLDNLPTSTAYKVTLGDTLPVGMTPVDGQGGSLSNGGRAQLGGVWNAAARTLNWMVNHIASGPAQVRSYRALVATTASAELRNTVVATKGANLPSGGPPLTDLPIAGNTVVVAGSPLRITKSADRQFTVPGGMSKSTIEVPVPAKSTAGNLIIRDLLRAGQSLAGDPLIACMGDCPAAASATPVYLSLIQPALSRTQL